MNNQTKPSHIPWESSLRYDAHVIVFFFIVLAAGLGLKAWVESRTILFSNQDPKLSLRYPVLWTTKQEKGELLVIRDLKSKGFFKTRFSVTVDDLESGADLSVMDLAELYTEEKANEFNAYRVLKTDDTDVDGRAGVKVTYAYVHDPGASSLQTFLPTVVKGVDILVVSDSNLYIFTFDAPAASYAQYSEILDGMLRSVNFDLED